MATFDLAVLLLVVSLSINDEKAVSVVVSLICCAQLSCVCRLVVAVPFIKSINFMIGQQICIAA
jgi:hypothetical protein